MFLNVSRATTFTDKMRVIISEKKRFSHDGLFDIRIDRQSKRDRYVMY